ncbi:MAG: rRNA maturation RNase YbeY [Lentisphaeria bacterium]
MKILLQRGRRVAALKKRAFFLSLLREVLPLTGFSVSDPGLLQVILLCPEEMVALNALHLGHHGVTDVITYDLRTSEAHFPDAEEPVLAEIYLCPDVACKNAKLYGQSPSRELFLYAVHGLLHLQGEDDLTETTRFSMRAAEARVMNAISPSLDTVDFF